MKTFWLVLIIIISAAATIGLCMLSDIIKIKFLLGIIGGN